MNVPWLYKTRQRCKAERDMDFSFLSQTGWILDSRSTFVSKFIPLPRSWERLKMHRTSQPVRKAVKEKMTLILWFMAKKSQILLHLTFIYQAPSSNYANQQLYYYYLNEVQKLHLFWSASLSANLFSLHYPDFKPTAKSRTRIQRQCSSRVLLKTRPHSLYCS